MTLLDRYIAKQYLFNIVALTVILFSFVVVVDASLNIDEFLEPASELAQQQGEDEPGALRRWIVTMLLVFDFWWPKLLQLYSFLIGMILVGAMGFTFSQLSRSREFVAMMAAGIGLHRVMKPIVVVASFFMVLQVINSELIIPRVAPLLVRDHNDIGSRSLGGELVPLTLDGSGRLFRAANFDADTSTLDGVYILERDENGKATRAIKAERATYRNGGWDLVGGVAEPRGDSTPRPPSPIARVESSLDPNTLRMNRYESYAHSLSFSQVSQMLDRPTLTDTDKRAHYARIKWGRFAMVLSAMLALIISMPFFITREPQNMVKQSIKCAPIAIIALIGGVLGASASIPGVPAPVGVFVPVMILSIVGVAQISAIKT